jgi:hypothetical protein
MVNSENTAICGEETRPIMSHRRIPLETLDICGAHSKGNAVQLGFRPGDRKRNRCIEEDAEIISVICVLPEIIGLELNESAQRLLKAGIELVSVAGIQRRASF